MKLWYQSLTQQAEGGTYLAALERIIAMAADPGTTVHVRAITQSAGIVELTKMGEMVAKLKALAGRFTSRRLHYAPPSGDYLKRIRSFYGPEIYPGAE